MVGVANHHRLAALILRLFDQLLDMGHPGTGGIYNRRTAPRERVIDCTAHPVGPQQDAIPRLRLIRMGEGCHPLLCQRTSNMLIVNDAAQHPGPLGSACQLPGHFHRPRHAKAKTGAFCLNHFHPSTSPSS